MSNSIMILKNKFDKGPYLLHLRYWLDTKFKQNNFLKVTLGEKHPKLYKNYVPGDRYVLFAIAHEHRLPTWRINYNNQSAEIDLNSYLPNDAKQYCVFLEKCKIFFMIELLDSTQPISSRYENDKLPEEERYRYNEGINELIRSEQQFLTEFDRDQDLELVKQAEKIESERQMQLTQQIMSIKSFNFSLKKFLIIFILFMIVGYLFSEPSPKPKKNKKKKPTKKSKVKKNR